MNRSANVQRSASPQSPVTPQRRTAPVALSPKNYHAERRCRILPRDPVTPNIQSLTHANARLIHERLQQNHNRLQVQLHARSPPASSVPTGHVKAFLETTFRAYASRIQSEFISLRAACVRAVQSERHQTAQLRSACARLTRERDVAEDKLRVLLDRRAAAGKRSRAQVEKEDADEDEETALLYPLSPVSPRQMPTQSPPPRLMSPFVLAVRRGQSHTPDPEDRTGFDLTIPGDTLPPPSKKRRMDVSSSPERTLEATASDPAALVTTERETCPAAGFGECDMNLKSAFESSDFSDTESSDPSDSASSQPLYPTSCSSRPVSSSPPTVEPKAPLHCRSSTAPSPPKLHLPLEYVDIMYQPSDGKLVCRVYSVLRAAAISLAPVPGRSKLFFPTRRGMYYANTARRCIQRRVKTSLASGSGACRSSAADLGWQRVRQRRRLHDFA
ncbi:hypothetical protein MSAN_01376700 [Mycena sanguinolenta]|uniref:Uncharacterized protein n=1 Tax=Mycena sanguinolenta TaxID=230812 RepID=A0A8H6Y8M4_9AGAR|nr:hypothetical protein MSAN_01376700 [Mycena sanguinolenta]